FVGAARHSLGPLAAWRHGHGKPQAAIRRSGFLSRAASHFSGIIAPPLHPNLWATGIISSRLQRAERRRTMRHFPAWLLGLACLAAALAGCSRERTVENDDDPGNFATDLPDLPYEPAVKKALVKGNTTFALDLYGRLRRQKGNLFLSPYSISSAL